MKSDSYWSRLQHLSLPVRAGILAASLLFAAGLVVPAAYMLEGPAGILAAFAAAFTCLVPGLIALGLGEVFRHPDTALYSLLFGTLIRMGLPLAACGLVYVADGPLAHGGFAFSLLVFYPVMLVVETTLLAAQVEGISQTKSGGVSHG
jgi:hypothetical protein